MLLVLGAGGKTLLPAGFAFDTALAAVAGAAAFFGAGPMISCSSSEETPRSSSEELERTSRLSSSTSWLPLAEDFSNTAAEFPFSTTWLCSFWRLPSNLLFSWPGVICSSLVSRTSRSRTPVRSFKDRSHSSSGSFLINTTSRFWPSIILVTTWRPSASIFPGCCSSNFVRRMARKSVEMTCSEDRNSSKELSLAFSSLALLSLALVDLKRILPSPRMRSISRRAPRKAAFSSGVFRIFSLNMSMLGQFGSSVNPPCT